MKTDVVKYSTNEAEISKMSAIYMNLTINGIDDIDGFNDVHDAKKVMVKHRTGVDKLRKSTNKNAQEFINTNNTNAKKLLDLIKPIEFHLKDEEKKITDEKARIEVDRENKRRIKIEERVNSLFAVGVNIQYFKAGMLTDDKYRTMLDEATIKHDAELLRLNTEQREKEDQAARIEADRIKIATMEAELKAIEDKEKANAAIKEREIFKQKAIDDAMATAGIERVKSEEKRIALETERIERELVVHTEIAQLEALKSDKDKLAEYAHDIVEIISPDVKDEAAHSIIVFAETQLFVIAKDILNKVENL